MTIAERPRHYKSRIRREYTQRQRAAMAENMSGATTYNALADVLSLSPRTEQSMLYSMYAKTGARNVADLILWKIRQD